MCNNDKKISKGSVPNGLWKGTMNHFIRWFKYKVSINIFSFSVKLNKLIAVIVKCQI